MNVIALSPFDLAIAALLILALAGLSLRMQIGVERQLLISAAAQHRAVVSDRPGAQGALRECASHLGGLAGDGDAGGRRARGDGPAKAPLCRRLGIRRRHPVDVRLVIHGDRCWRCSW
jgi:hypothetical protein